MNISDQPGALNINFTAADNNALSATTPKNSDIGLIFFIIIITCYGIFVAISDSMKILNDRLRLLQDDLQTAVKLQGYMTNTLTTTEKIDKVDYVTIGGPNTDGEANVRAQEIIDYLSSKGLDPKIPIATPGPTKILLTVANQISNSLNSQVDLTRQQAQTETTKASSVQNSANAALDLSTTLLKNLTGTLMAIAQYVVR